MADIFDQDKRARVMARVRGRNTTPEMAVRRFLHAGGLRFRLHRGDLPGRPDLVFPSRRVAIFVHGCFWHRHPGCPRATLPATRPDFWRAKLEANAERDARALEALRGSGWTALVIWECEVGPDGLESLYQRIVSCPAAGSRVG